MDVLYKTSLRFSYCQIYHGSLGAVAVAVRNISSSSANFASAGKLSSRTWNKLFYCSRSTTHCNLLTQEWHTSVEFNCLGEVLWLDIQKTSAELLYVCPVASCCRNFDKLWLFGSVAFVQLIVFRPWNYGSSFKVIDYELVTIVILW